MAIYDFDALQERFPLMSEKEVLEEYARILREIDEIDALPFSEEGCERMSPLMEARDYLGYYLACKYCEEQGVEIY